MDAWIRRRQRTTLPPPSSARTGLAASLREGLAAYARGGIAGLHPAYFAVAMATGIVAIASHLLGLTHAARALYWVNLVAYALVWAAMLARLTLFPARFLEDVRSHPRGPGYFTVVAATGVLGSQVTLMGGAPELGRALFWLAAVLWVICVRRLRRPRGPRGQAVAGRRDQRRLAPRRRRHAVAARARLRRRPGRARRPRDLRCSSSSRSGCAAGCSTCGSSRSSSTATCSSGSSRRT
ncbi:MAG: hypothetical protein M5U28_56540 [Sandaracinaceae bacterium]|nr:hypothetical protein [Sandaracinaceae bacterium]